MNCSGGVICIKTGYGVKERVYPKKRTDTTKELGVVKSAVKNFKMEKTEIVEHRYGDRIVQRVLNETKGQNFAHMK